MLYVTLLGVNKRALCRLTTVQNVVVIKDISTAWGSVGVQVPPELKFPQNLLTLQAYPALHTLCMHYRRQKPRKCQTQGGPPKVAPFLYAYTLPNISWFSKLFHCQNQEKICNNTKLITEDPTPPQVCRYTTLWNVKCLKSNNWKRDDFYYNKTF